ncbi:Bug family tripartite tricarboxylate transporter substrate binding protein [Cupriavidus basilensis]|uniref:Bug family tripartite tricarboxylate transporter substrate binding protein n=1 Tax=Cupriavidus basilensis TaxID=68895 RepID=UPI0007513240|nr:tripartite tricarboxylate transporter substrate binding protein [Cupriavidus basilensis]
MFVSFRPSTSLMPRRIVSLLSMASLALAGVFVTPAAQAQWPEQSIRLVVPFPPGGLADLVARPLAEKLSIALKQPVVVENRGGASGTLGTAHVAASKPDGYTLLFATANEIAVSPILYPNLRYTPFDSFTPIASVVDFPSVLVTAPNKPATYQALVADVKAHPGCVSFASSGAGTTNHLMAELFREAENTQVLHVHYKGGGPAMADVAAGHVDAMFATLPSALGQIRGGSFQAIAVSSPKRSAALPDVPSLVELGRPELAVTIWAGVLAPADLPSEITRRLNKEIGRIAQDPQFKRFLEQHGATLRFSSPEGLKQSIAEHYQRWSKTIQSAGIALN